VLARALDSVDDVGSKVGGALVGFGKTAAQTAAKTAVKGGGQAAWALARGAAKGAWNFGAKSLRGGEEEGGELDDVDGRAPAPELTVVAPRALLGPPPGGPAAHEIPELIRKLAKLRSEGILTDAEFQTKKAELLARL